MTDAAAHVTCQEVVELITDYLEGAMPADEATLFEQHLTFCEGCVTYVEQMRATVAHVGRVRETDLRPEARAALLAAFRDWRRA